MNYKYIILFPIEGAFAVTINSLMDRVHAITGKEQPYKKLLPHITFHRPIKGISEQKIIKLTKSIALKLRTTRITVNAVHHFGSEYVVLPVHATKTLAALWTGIHDTLSQVPEYEHGQFDHDNTLHVTVGDGLSSIFEDVWNSIRSECVIDAITIPVQKIEVWRKSDAKHSAWDRVVEIPLTD